MNPEITFAHPWMLVGLALLPLYAALRFRLRRRDRVVYPPLQFAGVHSGRNSRGFLSVLPLPVEILLVAVLILGLAGPQRESTVDLIEDEGIDVVLLLDISLSMLAEDFPPNRLEVLRQLSSDFISRAGSHRVGIIIFASDAFVQVPLTTDHKVLRELLGAVSVHAINQGLSGGTAIGDALLVTADLLESSRIEGRDQALILITDGESNMGSDPLVAAQFVEHLGVRLYSIGIGGEEPIEVFFEGERVGEEDDPYLAQLDDTQLREITATAGGLYFRAIDAGALEAIFGELSRLESAPLEVRQLTVSASLSRWAGLAALPLFALYLFLGGVVLRRPLR